ncbi:small, acid-soluble spore protein K [Bacillus suaedae]|uniref:small, acid-soluble spore protein K n=1 Tax=Halalkalibacter suaedae TaxID=2822140 RepID=UPI001FF07E11|nr:small, acid-soluble spore protein K [Bacillus suaedae]
MLERGKQLVRNKAKGFPNHIKFQGNSPKDHNKHESLRADGTINTHPRERMRNSDGDTNS